MARIFLVDDDVDLVAMNKAVLETKGHEVEVAFNGDEARAALAAARPDVAVLDVMMEDTTAGFRLARDIHAQCPGLPMLMLTGIREAENIKFQFEPDETWLPVAKFVEKPITPDALAAEVEALLN